MSLTVCSMVDKAYRGCGDDVLGGVILNWGILFPLDNNEGWDDKR